MIMGQILQACWFVDKTTYFFDYVVLKLSPFEDFCFSKVKQKLESESSMGFVYKLLGY